MYAIVAISGKQMKVKPNDTLYVPKLNTTVGSAIPFDKVLLLDTDGKTTIGMPTIAGAQVVAKVLTHIKADKITVFKKKRRKGYKKTQGHRQELTKICIEKIVTP